MAEEIKCIIFDVGNVLTSERIDYVFDELNGLLGRKVFSRKSTIHRQYLSGKITENNYYTILAKKAKIPKAKLRQLTINKYKETIKTRKEVLQLAKLLRKNSYKTAIISNITPEHKRIKKQLGIFNGFSPLIFSCDVKYRKPQKKIFQIALKGLKTKPEECIFIDDRESHLIWPENLGMKTIHFRNGAQLKRDLRKMGVKI